jgi:hypothetical protein
MDEAVEAATISVSVTGTKPREPLYLAAANGNAEMCRFLTKTCGVDATDSDGNCVFRLLVPYVDHTEIKRVVGISDGTISKFNLF